MPKFKEQFKEYSQELAAQMGVSSVMESFNLTEPVAIQMINAVVKSSAFLKSISSIGVTDGKGEIVTIEDVGSIASRTKTSAGTERVPRDIGTFSGRFYSCEKVNFDASILYSKLDTWARFGDLQARLTNAIRHAMALDMIKIGFYGTSLADNSDIATNPLLQDVSKGWLTRLKEGNAANYIDDAITVGANSDYANLNQLVNTLYKMIPLENRTGSEVAIIGSDLIAFDTNKMLEKFGNQPSEQLTPEVYEKSYAGLKALIVPFFPERSVFVGDPRQLQIYFQTTAIRRHFEDVPKKDRIEHYNSGNYAWDIADLDGVVYLDGTKLTFDYEKVV